MPPSLYFIYLGVNIGNTLSETGYQLSKRDYFFFIAVIYSYPLLLAHCSQVTTSHCDTGPGALAISLALLLSIPGDFSLGCP